MKLLRCFVLLVLLCVYTTASSPTQLKKNLANNYRFAEVAVAVEPLEPVQDETVPKKVDDVITSANNPNTTDAINAATTNRGGAVTVSRNSPGNNIAIQNGNNVIINGAPTAGGGITPAQLVQPAIVPKDSAAEPAFAISDEQKIKQDAANKQADEFRKQTEVVIDKKWSAFGGDYENPNFYLMKNAVCFVFGVARGSDGVICTLPTICRPKGRLVFTVMGTNKPTRVDVFPDGRVIMIAGGGDGWVSLSGISFSVDANPSPTLVGGWLPFGSEYRPHSLTKQGSLCMLSGVVKGGKWGTFGQVDADCTPDRALVFSLDNHDTVTRVDLQTNGYFSYAGGSAEHGWMSLDGMVWTKAKGMPITLLNGWVNYGNWRDATYSVVQNLCVLSGLIRNPQDWPNLIGKLPAECRPSKRLIFPGNVQTTSARIDILPDGSIVYVAGKSVPDWVSLSNIHFFVNS